MSSISIPHSCEAESITQISYVGSQIELHKVYRREQILGKQLKEGGVWYLVKPGGMAELEGTVKYLVGRARQEVTKSETSQANTYLFQS